MSKAVVFDEFGTPTEVLRVREIATPSPSAGEVRVRMIASPINPSDLLVVRGEYGRLPKLPATPGFEGVGVVEAAGPGLLGKLRLGKRVAVLNSGGGNWREQVTVPARQVVPVHSSVTDEQAAAFFVNPASALLMTRYILRVPEGEWLLQTAAGSGARANGDSTGPAISVSHDQRRAPTGSGRRVGPRGRRCRHLLQRRIAGGAGQGTYGRRWSTIRN